VDSNRPLYRAAFEHVLGTSFDQDREIFFAGEGEKIHLSLHSDNTRLVFFVSRFLEKTFTDIYFSSLDNTAPPELIFPGIDYRLSLRLRNGKILAMTDREAPNRRIVEIRIQANGPQEWIDIIPESDALMSDWSIVADRILVSYRKDMTHRISYFALCGEKLGEMPVSGNETLRLISAASDSDEVFFATESFTEPIRLFRYSVKTNERTIWARTSTPFDSANYAHSQVRYTSKDGTSIPMFLVGRRDTLERGGNPTIMTSYGGYGISMTPQFSVLVAFLMERGCLFALPNIRGGSEFGVQWRNAAKRRNRQTAYDDFLSGAEWLLGTGRTAPGKLAIFGGSNSGLLVAAALTQRPDLFRAVICMVPLLDMIRYHLFDNAHVWKDEFGTADDPEDFAALSGYSPYHRVRDGVAYPATMIVSGDADQNCNPLHARKMTARLQAATVSKRPIFLDYSKFRGHSPVLPLGERVEALTDRIAFLCDQLQLPA
jgi:prolyl oligopeptidase